MKERIFNELMVKVAAKLRSAQTLYDKDDHDGYDGNDGNDGNDGKLIINLSWLILDDEFRGAS